jgi:molybdopterin converting factor small subunit
MSEITVSVSFFNILAIYAGKKHVDLLLPESATLQQVLEYLKEKGTPQLNQILFQNGEFSKYIKIFLNQQLIAGIKLETPLENGDELMLFPAIAGG